ncbi:trypsin-like serine peptidase [Epibacterium ulvae]|uniref:trypsin-like serine peptidase n=1 Tax=Epibacterium ulvae TaxID=1156985 RepID=UPI003EB886A3
MSKIITAALVAVSGVLATPSFAQDSRLERLETLDAGRKWDAVGRLDLNGQGLCTGALIAPDLVLTAAHCLFDPDTSVQFDPTTIEFLAGWRNGRASAYRSVQRATVHPSYVYNGEVSSGHVRNDIALLQLQRPIRNTTVIPFETDARPRKGDKIGVVSYAHDRAEVPSLQEVCGIMARQRGVLVMSCDVDFGSSGAPVFSFETDTPRIVSVISAKAEVKGERVSLGASLAEDLDLLRANLTARNGSTFQAPVGARRVRVGDGPGETGAKFVKP